MRAARFWQQGVFETAARVHLRQPEQLVERGRVARQQLVNLIQHDHQHALPLLLQALPLPLPLLL